MSSLSSDGKLSVNAHVQEAILTFERLEPPPESLLEWFPQDSGIALYDGSLFGGEAEKQPLTYAGLKEQVEACPRFVAGTRVGLLATASDASYLATALLGIMYQKAIACPLNPFASVKELVEAIEQLNIQVVLCSKELVGKLNSLKSKISIMVFKKDPEVIGVFKAEQLGKAFDKGRSEGLGSNDDNVVLLLRTSGTTSTPKPVPITLENLWFNARRIGSSLALQRSDINLNVMPFFHIGGIACSLLATLVSGSQLICGPHFEIHGFLRRLQSSPEPTWYYAVPTIHKAVLLQTAKLKHFKPRNLRLVRSGAAHLPHKDAVALEHAFKDATILPTYSMSECMPICSTMKDAKKPKDSVGKSIGPSLRIADEAGNPLPYEQTGEVLISGPGVISGYMGRSKSKDFVDGHWLRTGDLGRLDKDGYLYLQGRIREMAKRGGEQISLLEVDNVIVSHPKVEVSLAFGIPNEFWGEEIAAAIVLTSNVNLTSNELKEFLADKLEHHKVPAQFFFVEEKRLPKTHTGKYKRSLLVQELNAKPVDFDAVHNIGATVNADASANCCIIA